MNTDTMMSSRRRPIAFLLATLLALTFAVGCGEESDPSLGNIDLRRLDSDRDGLSDDDERDFGTDPDNPDSDNDGVGDGGDSDTYCKGKTGQELEDCLNGARSAGENGEKDNPYGYLGLLTAAAGRPLAAIASGQGLGLAKFTLTGDVKKLVDGCSKKFQVLAMMTDGSSAQICTDLTAVAPENPGAAVEAGGSFTMDTQGGKIEVNYIPANGQKNEMVKETLDTLLYFGPNNKPENFTLSSDQCAGQANTGAFFMMTATPQGSTTATQWRREAGASSAMCQNGIPAERKGAAGAWVRP